jgi:hypothetical protein
MGPAAARLHTMVDVVGYRTSVAAVFAVGCNIDLGLNWGRFVKLEGMMAAVGCNTPSSLVVDYLVDFGHRMTVGDCSRRLCFVWADCLLLDKTRLELALCILVYSGCPLVDRMKEVLVLCIHLDAVRSHCSQSYFATSVSISKLPHS